MTKLIKSTCTFLTFLSITLLAACSDGSSDNSAGDGRGGTQNGFLTLSITDAVIDNASEVWVQFDAVVLKPGSATEAITIDFDPPMTINLLALQGQKSLQMLVDQTLPSGAYDWIRLNVTATDDGILDSYLKLTDNTVHDLNIPSGAEAGLKIIGGLEIIANTPTQMTIDFDLRKSIILASSGKYELVPVLNLTNDAETGSITGIVEQSALTDPSCPDSDPATGNVIYLYEGFNVTADNILAEPVASAIPTLNDASGEYEYDFGFIPFGKYTATYTCYAISDDDLLTIGTTFIDAQNINVTGTRTVMSSAFR